MCAWKYKRTMPKLTVAKLKLMEHKSILDLTDMNLDQISLLLEKTPYKSEIYEVRSRELSSNSLEDALLQNYINTCEALMEFSPKRIRLFLSTLLMKFEADCIKTILRAKQANLSVDKTMKFIMPVGRLDAARCKKILEISENLVDVVEAFSDMEYGSILEKAYTVYEEEKIFYHLEIAIDRYVYSKIWRAIGKLGGLDKKISRIVIGLEIDALNIETILRCKAMGIAKDEIKRYLIPLSEVFSEKELEELIQESDIQAFIGSLVKLARHAMVRDYQYIFDEIQKQNVTSPRRLEMILDRGLVETNLRMIKRHTPFFNIGLLLAFLNLKWFEIRNLRAIIRGIERGIPPDKIKKVLIFPR